MKHKVVNTTGFADAIAKLADHVLSGTRAGRAQHVVISPVLPVEASGVWCFVIAAGDPALRYDQIRFLDAVAAHRTRAALIAALTRRRVIIHCGDRHTMSVTVEALWPCEDRERVRLH
jgi:hypothetical protein